MIVLQHKELIDPPRPGSCLFTENLLPRFLDRLLERVTQSPLAHVAIILPDPSGAMVVYEAVPPCVRKVTWRCYIDEILPKWAAHRWTQRLGGLNTLLWEPREGLLSQEQISGMTKEAESLLGLKYGLFWNYLWETWKIHCSEFVSQVWATTGLIEAGGGRESPGSLYRKLLGLDSAAG